MRASKTVPITVLGLSLGLLCTSFVLAQPAPIGEAFQVNLYTTESQSRPAVTSLADGNFLVLWQSRGQDGDFEGVYARRFDTLGMPLSGEIPVNSITTNSQGSPQAQVGPQGVVGVWRDGGFDGDAGSIMLKAGAPAEFLVNTYTTGNHGCPDLALDSDGDFVVVWENSADQDGDDRGVFGQLFDSAGDFVGPEFTVNSTTSGFQDRPRVDGLDDGRFVVVWNAEAGSDAQVMAQRFGSDGLPEGAEITVNAPTYNRNDPEVAMAANGSFVVVWRSYVDPTYEIYRRRFNSSGVPTMPSIPLEDAPGLGGNQPATQRDPNNQFLVVWHDGIGELKARSLDTDGSEIGDSVTLALSAFHSDVAFSSTADYVGLAVWTESDTDGDGLGVFARLIGPASIFTDGFESGDTTAWSNTVP